VPGARLDFIMTIPGNATWDHFVDQVCQWHKRADWQNASERFVRLDGIEVGLDENIDSRWRRGSGVQVDFGNRSWEYRMGTTGAFVQGS
jgi:hypothetical protein